MSLDPKTLKLLTAKDQYLELNWLDAAHVTYLEANETGFDLLQDGPSGLEKIATGLGSTLPYAGQLYAVEDRELSYLRRDACLLVSQTVPLPGPSTDLRLKNGNPYLISEIDGSDHLLRFAESQWQDEYQSSDILRHLSLHPSEAKALLLSWPRTELPWLAAELKLLHLDSSHAVEDLCPPGLQSPCAEAEFSPSGDYIVASFLTDEFFQLWLYKLKTKNWVQLTFDSAEHSTPLRRSGRRTFTFIRDGLLVYSSFVKGFWRLDTLDYSGRGHKIPFTLTYIQNPRAQPETGDIAFLGASLEVPLAALRMRHESALFKLQSLEKNRLPVEPQFKAERISWSSVNGETIHGILYRDSSRTTPAPLILPIHGGPCDAVHATWPSKALAFVRQGYAVLYVNYRGSFGYGISYLQKLEAAFGHLEIKDLISGVKSLEDSGWIDATRVGLWGGGVASHTVLRALSLHPEIFAAGVAVFPILDMSRHLSACSLAERNELIWALGSADPMHWDQESAKHLLPNLSRPLALFAGGKDSLTDVSVLQDLSQSMKDRKVPCWLSVYEGEGRSFRSRETYDDYYSKVAGFFDRFLKFRS